MMSKGEPAAAVSADDDGISSCKMSIVKRLFILAFFSVLVTVVSIGTMFAVGISMPGEDWDGRDGGGFSWGTWTKDDGCSASCGAGTRQYWRECLGDKDGREAMDRSRCGPEGQEGKVNQCFIRRCKCKQDRESVRDLRGGSLLKQQIIKRFGGKEAVYAYSNVILCYPIR